MFYAAKNFRDKRKENRIPNQHNYRISQRTFFCGLMRTISKIPNHLKNLSNIYIKVCSGLFRMTLNKKIL